MPVRNRVGRRSPCVACYLLRVPSLCAHWLAAALAVLAASLACSGEPAMPVTMPAPTATPERAAAATATRTIVLTASPMPSPTPKATPSPAPTATPSPSPTVAPTPVPCSGVECIEPAPNLFEHRIWEQGESVRDDWRNGSFVLDPETGRIEGYRLKACADRGDCGLDRYYEGGRGSWFATLYDRGSDRGEDRWSALLNRETRESWHWPPCYLRLVAMSRARLLFEDRAGGDYCMPTGRFMLLNREMESIARFTVGDGEGDPRAIFSPDGLTIVLEVEDDVYLVPVDSVRPTLLFRPQPHDVLGEPGGAFIANSWLNWSTAPNIHIGIWYGGGDGGRVADGEWQERYFSWDGDPLPAPAESACAGTPSPDGRYVAVPEGEPVFSMYLWSPLPPNPWASVRIVDVATCEPILRVRSVRLRERVWVAAWLSTSDGFVVGVNDGYMIARIRPEPGLVRLPFEDESGPWDTGPDPAPTGDGCFFGYGPNVYDACEDRWFDYGWSSPDGPAGWGATYRERWFVPRYYWGEGWVEWLLLPPKMEFPPFDDEIAFRVTGTGSCLSLREQPDADAVVRDCLPDGSRLRFVKLEETLGYRPGLYRGSVWVYVRAESGVQGWVSHEYLEWD